jgi:hypothetical protein
MYFFSTNVPYCSCRCGHGLGPSRVVSCTYILYGSTFERILRIFILRPSAMAGYLTSYYDVDRQKVGERLVTSDEEIAYLFHVVQEFVR